jgi:nitroreductase
MKVAKTFDEIVKWRRSVRLYDTDASFDSNVVDISLDRALLAPTSSNLQLFEIYRIKSPQKLEKLARYCLSQPAATTAKELMVFVVRRDKWSERAKFNYDELSKLFGEKPTPAQRKTLLYYSQLMPFIYINDSLGICGMLRKLISLVFGMFRPIYRGVSLTDIRIIAHKSCALVAQTFMLSMAAEGYDTCPMEGFDESRVKKLLNLPGIAEISLIVAAGIRKQDGVYGPRLRLAKQQLVFEL